MKGYGTRLNYTKVMLHKNDIAMVPSMELTCLSVQSSNAGFMSDECR